VSIVEHVNGEVMTYADGAHLALRRATERIESDYWALADAIHEAHEYEAWMHDDGAHEARYRLIMTEQNFTSVFLAYCWDEFGFRAGYTPYLDLAGRARATMTRAIVQPDWSRFTLGSLRPIGSAIVSTYDPDDIAAALVTAQRIASKDVKPKAGADLDALRAVAPVKPTHVRAALIEHGIHPPRAKGLNEMEANERRLAKIGRARDRSDIDVSLLIREGQYNTVTNLICSAIRRMADQPNFLATIRKELG